MPKLKTHSGTKDRVRLTKNGKAQVKRSHSSHFLQKKTGARKRTFAGLQTLDGANSKNVKLNLGA